MFLFEDVNHLKHFVAHLLLKELDFGERMTRYVGAPKKDAQVVGQWAVMLDTNTPVSDFHELIPDMAQKVCNYVICGIRYVIM